MAKTQLSRQQKDHLSRQQLNIGCLNQEMEELDGYSHCRFYISHN